ncbi:hypothetical protein [Paramicrobacterium agarici]|uniref:Uncharacterized protein n=1 Tax=Paramicrobacterium agarici TaxID=630514 RepID=A0A2A9DVF9_9MICO|nr:hypothetical protein [Microbacterium agarici]PFG30346.1 hypothetical protein ATJ78_1275 [Microbacterium agarici]
MDYLGTYSPQGHHLMVLDGSADDIDRRGDYLKTVGETMDDTATSLKMIGEGTQQISEAVDKVREAASKIHGDLSKAATRYTGTGKSLVAYAEVLRAATRNIDPLVEEIATAQTSVSTAIETHDDAQGVVSDNNRTWIWEEEATDAEKAAAQSDLEDAESALSIARSTLEGLWAEFDAHYVTWEEGYDEAVNGIESAITEADNNDGWFADLMKILNKICFVLAVVALFVSGPIAGVILVVTTVVAVVQLSRDIYALSQGEGSWGDVIVGAVGLIPFGGGVARVVGRGGRGLVNSVRYGDDVLGGLRAAGRGSGRQTVQELSGMWRNATAGPRSIPVRNEFGLMTPRTPVPATPMNNLTHNVYGLTHPQSYMDVINNSSSLNGLYTGTRDNVVSPFITNPPYNEANASY